MGTVIIVTMSECAGEKHSGIDSLSLVFMHNPPLLFCVPVYKHFIIRILCTTDALKDTAFRCICLQSAASLVLSFCLSPAFP